MNKILFVIFAGAILIGVIVYFLFPRPQPDSIAKPTRGIPEPTTLVLPSIDVSVPANWVPFTSETYHFSIQYPLDMQHQLTQEGERFYKLGPTQSHGTELYDGISVMIRAGKLSGQSLNEFVQKKQTEARKDPLQPEIGEMETVTIANLQGFSFRVRSIGDASYIYLPKGKDEYLEIIDGTVEPTNRTQTFKKIVNQMLSTLKAK